MISFNDRPKVNCRFRIRDDLCGKIGYFENRSILFLNDTSAEILQQLDGQKTIREIIKYFKKKYPQNTKEIEKDVLKFINSINVENFLVINSKS